MNKYLGEMWLLLLLLLLLEGPVVVYADTPSQPPAATQDQLFRTIAALDTEVFDGYNRCDLEKFARYFVENVEFYHDTGGVTWTRKDVVDGVKKYICGKVRRELVPGTLAVYPIKDFGAVEIGDHIFCELDTNKCEGIAKFILIWQNKDGDWKITRVISYDHRPVKK